MRDKKPTPAKRATKEDYFADMGLDAEELAAEGPPPKKEKKI